MSVQVIAAQPSNPSTPWSTGLFDCQSLGLSQCLYGWCCPQCALADARNKFDTSDWCFNCMCLGSPAMARSIIRKGYNIQGSCVNDLCLGTLCLPCVVCQLMGEVNKRGLLVSQRVTQGSDHWREDSFSCCSNCGTCCYTCCCPHCANASSRSAYDGSDIIFNLLACLTPPLARNIVREGYGIEGTAMGDCLWACCCPSCSICQLLNESRARRITAATTSQNVVIVQQQPMFMPPGQGYPAPGYGGPVQGYPAPGYPAPGYGGPVQGAFPPQYAQYPQQFEQQQGYPPKQ